MCGNTPGVVLFKVWSVEAGVSKGTWYVDAQVTVVLMGVGMSRDMWRTLELRIAQGGDM